MTIGNWLLCLIVLLVVLVSIFVVCTVFDEFRRQHERTKRLEHKYIAKHKVIDALADIHVTTTNVGIHFALSHVAEALDVVDETRHEIARRQVAKTLTHVPR